MDVCRLAHRDLEREETLSRAARVSRLSASLLLGRGIDSAEGAAAFFDPAAQRLHDPFSMKGVEEASDLLVHAARSGRRIVVFGDYDVDGVTAVAQLRAALSRAGADAVAFLPHRLRDGYGLRPETVRRVLAEHRPDVIVTVDCGITAVEGVACAREAGVAVVVTDHHLVPEELPAGAIVVNPKQRGCEYPEKDLSGSGLAFKLALAVAARGGFALSVESLLRAASLGTIADVVPLVGENRVIAAAGLAALACPRAPGLSALLQASGIAPGVAPRAEQIAYRVAPRLNAAGRLDTAELALRAFEVRDRGEAAAIAQELSLRNAHRQTIERRVTAEARERVSRGYDLSKEALIVEADAGWHRGVLGIAAARIAREFHRPVLLFGLDGDRATGSGRSIPGVSLHDTLQELAGFFLEFGGHDQAVGGSLPASRFEEFRQAARAHFTREVPSARLQRDEGADWELPFEDVGEDLARELDRFEPHGAGNPRPTFFCPEAVPDGPGAALGDHGVRTRFAGKDGMLPAVCWSEEAGAALALRRPLALRFRVGRDRRGSVEAEILSAWPAGGVSATLPADGLEKPPA